MKKTTVWTGGRQVTRREFVGRAIATGVVFSQESPAANPNDLNGDGKVNAADLAILLGNWGLTPATAAQGDLDGNQTVNAADLALLLGAWAP